MDINTAKLNVKMPDGSLWQVPVKCIAEHCAAFYADDRKIPLEQSLRKTHELFSSCPDEIEDWAENNMNWSDVADRAVMISAGSTDYDDGWCNGEKEIVSWK